MFIIDVATLDLSTGARTLLEHVLSCGHYTETPRYSSEVLTLVEAFERQPTKPHVSWKYYLYHDGSYYELSFQRH